MSTDQRPKPSMKLYDKRLREKLERKRGFDVDDTPRSSPHVLPHLASSTLPFLLPPRPPVIIVSWNALSLSLSLSSQAKCLGFSYTIFLLFFTSLLLSVLALEALNKALFFYTCSVEPTESTEFFLNRNR